VTVFGLAIVALALLGSPAAWAQSSGNFVATVDNTVCSVNTMDGNLMPPPPIPPSPGSLITTGPGGGTMQAIIKLPGSLPGLLVTPSLATGMYTNTQTATFLAPPVPPSQTAAIVVAVTDTLGSNTVTLTPNQTCVDTSATVTTTPCTSPGGTCVCGVVYDERFQALSTTIPTFFGNIDLVLSTMAAHSFNFTEGSVPGGTHTITMQWVFGCDDGTGKLSTAQCMNSFAPNSAAACAGPGTLTVQQVQNFQHDSQIQTTHN